ncbi:MAG: hypothetical protein Q4P72_03110 [Eubacteriales bacterium]|nr:hypothetical protein [Eubacteriales bacterium]
MQKKFILYSLNPLLAGLLLIGSLGGIYIEHDKPFTASETKVVLPMYPEDDGEDAYDSEAYFQRIPDPFASGLIGTKTVKKKLLKQEEKKPYELVYQDGQFIFQPAVVVENRNILSLVENEDTVAENDDRLILFTLNENGHDQFYYFTVNFDFQDLECPIWDRLKEKKDSYYRVLMDGERIIFAPLPPKGILRSKIKAGDLFALVKFDIIPLRKEAKKADAMFREDENSKEHKITFLLISGDEVKNKKKHKKRKKSSSQPSVQYYVPGSTVPSREDPYDDDNYYDDYDHNDVEDDHSSSNLGQTSTYSNPNTADDVIPPSSEFTPFFYESWLKEQQATSPPADEIEP